MSYFGDILEDATIDFKFPTVAAGVPTTLAGTPVLSAYKANGTTQSTAGITLTVDFDSVTGLNHVRVDTSADAFYATGNDYDIVVTTGTVDSVSAVGYVVGSFSIENRTAVSSAAVADAVWDEELTGATHNVANSAGKRLRTIDAAFEVHSGTAQAGSTSTTLVMDTGADGTNNDIYQGDRIVITGGTGAGEHGLIKTYVASTRTATMAEAWVVTPDNTSEFTVVPADVDIESWNHSSVTGDGDWAALKAETALVVADTNELQTDWVDGGRLDLILDAILSDTNAILVDTNITIDGKTLSQVLALIAAGVAGKVSGAGTATETFRDIADGRNAIVSTVDASGNRTAVTITDA